MSRGNDTRNLTVDELDRVNGGTYRQKIDMGFMRIWYFPEDGFDAEPYIASGRGLNTSIAF